MRATYSMYCTRSSHGRTLPILTLTTPFSSILGMEDYIDEHERKAAAWENSQIVGNSRESLIDESIEDERIGEKEAGSVGDG